MRKIAFFLLAALLLSACSMQPVSGAKTPEELTEKYLAAIMNEKYEAVLNLLPAEIIEYGKSYLEGDIEDVVDFVRYAAYDYYWLAQLSTHKSYTYEISAIGSEFPESAKKESVLLEEDGVCLYAQDIAGIELTVTAADEEPVEGSLFILKIEGRWYLMSVAGDDEIFVY